MTSRPRVTIIIPTYNHAHYVRGAIDSALAQTFADVGVVVIDDGSTDDTPAVAASYAGRVTWLRQDTNRGLPAARNVGLAHAHGDFVVFLDADDALTPDAVARKVDVLDRDPAAGWVFSDVHFMDAEGRTHGRASEHLRYATRQREGMIFADLLRGNFITPLSVLVRRSALDAVGWFDESLVRAAEDWDLWLRVARRFPVAYVDAPLGYYRRAPGSMTSDRLSMAIGNLEVMAHVEARWPDDVARARAAWQRHKASQCLRAAMDLRPSLGRAARLAWIWRAIRARPVQGAAYRVLVATLLRGRPGRASRAV